MAAGNVLHHWDSDKGCPYAQRSKVALLEKGLAFEDHLVDLGNKPEPFKALYAELNPAPGAAAKVPILIDGDVRLYESAVCTEYIAAKWADVGEPLLPADPGAAARARLFAETVSGAFTPAVFALLRADSAAGVAEGRERLEAALRTLDSFITLHGNEEGGSYFLGGAFSLAEVFTLGFVQRALATLPHFRGVDLRAAMRAQGCARLERWVDSTLARQSARDTCPSDDTICQSWGKFVTPLADG